MDYKKIYDSVIVKAKSENRKKHKGVYYESHHIIPKSIGGNDEKPNRVLLTAREHFVCHKLLCSIYPNNIKLFRAFHVMVHACYNKNKEKIDRKLSSRDFEQARIYASICGRRENLSAETLKKLSEASSGENNYWYGRHHTDEQRRMISESHKGEKSYNYGKTGELSHNFGRHHSEETIKMQRERMKGKGNHFFGKTHTDEVKKGLSESRIGKPSGSKGIHKTEEQKEKQRKAMTGKKQTPETIAKRVLKNTGIKRTDKFCMGLSKRFKGVPKSRDQILKMVETKRRNKELNPDKRSANYGRKNPEGIARMNEARRLIREEKLTMIF